MRGRSRNHYATGAAHMRKFFLRRNHLNLNLELFISGIFVLNSVRCIGAQVGGLTIKNPSPSTVFKTPPSILFMNPPPPPPENPLNNVLVQQMFAKMKNFAAGIIYTFFRYTFFKLCKEQICACDGNTAQTLTAVNNPCYIHLVDTFT